MEVDTEKIKNRQVHILEQLAKLQARLVNLTANLNGENGISETEKRISGLALSMGLSR